MSLPVEIRNLEAISRRLEPDGEVRKSVRDSVLAYTEDFLDRIGEIPAFVFPHDGGTGILGDPIGEEPAPIDRLLGLIRENIDRPGLNPASGGHLAYIPGGGLYNSALGDYMAAVMNRYAGAYFGGPGAVRLENFLLDWMKDIVGYPAGSAGNLTSGGSIANLIGVVAARDGAGLKAADTPRAVIYLTTQAHHSVHKAIRIAGLGEAKIRVVPVDSRFRMSARQLGAAIAGDKRKGLIPLMVIAAAGSTDAGAVDPLEEIGEIAWRSGVWYHIDAAYGGFFVLCDEGKKILGGMGMSDSLVMDPHKGLFLPYGTGAVLVKNSGQLLESFHYRANYMQDAIPDPTAHSPADLSPELTKHFRGLRLWLPLKLHGLAPFRAGLAEKLLLARYFHGRLAGMEGFERGPEPDLSVVTYRYVPRRGDPDRFNEMIIREVKKDGRVFLSSTILNGRYTLRLAALAFRTHLDTIDLALDILKHTAKKLETSV
ncbi:MAG TPA: aminotransferase class V-fold PLP-dependent enzyme [Bacteroidota bacterium]|nr:aminotransferase class V-fold PLP-dependent enzyme [Bacteroidota bacterium]